MTPGQKSGRGSYACLLALAAAALLGSGCNNKADTALLGAGNDDATPVASAPQDSPRAQIARLEARRHAGVPDLIQRANQGSAAAIRALGRAHDPAATKALAARLPTGGAAEIEALWLAGTATNAEAIAARYTPEAALAVRLAVVRVLGRLGDLDQLPALTAALADPSSEVRAEAAIALGIYGRRKLHWSPTARAALRALPLSSEAERYGAAYALASEHQWQASELEGDRALVNSLASSGSETRALWFKVSKRYGIAPPNPLPAGDWLAHLAYVRAYAKTEPEQLIAGPVVHWSERRATELHYVPLQQLVAVPGGAYPLREALIILRPQARVWHELFERVERMADDTGNRDLAELRCLARAGLAVRANSLEPVLKCPGYARQLHAALVMELVGELPVEPRTTELLSGYLHDGDARVRSLAIATLIASDRPELAALTAEMTPAALADPAPAVAGSAADAITTRATAGRPIPAAWTTALLARARTATDDPELIATLLSALLAVKATDTVALCTGLRAHWNYTIRTQATHCTEQLGATTAAPATIAVPPAPPVDPGQVAGRAVTWKVATNRGAFTITMNTEVAPLAIAALSKLAAAGFYDGLSWHRVVPGFVVQGGDPTGTGWGGPGFLLPAEPSALPFSRGAVGIADAGLDTGGSQLFVTHARAAHLEGRYTLIGYVTEGMEVVDRITAGDRIANISVAIR